MASVMLLRNEDVAQAGTDEEEFVASLPKPPIYGPAQPGVLPLTTE